MLALVKEQPNTVINFNDALAARGLSIPAGKTTTERTLNSLHSPFTKVRDLQSEYVIDTLSKIGLTGSKGIIWNNKYTNELMIARSRFTSSFEFGRRIAMYLYYKDNVKLFNEIMSSYKRGEIVELPIKEVSYDCSNFKFDEMVDELFKQNRFAVMQSEFTSFTYVPVRVPQFSSSYTTPVFLRINNENGLSEQIDLNSFYRDMCLRPENMQIFEVTKQNTQNNIIQFKTLEQ